MAAEKWRFSVTPVRGTQVTIVRNGKSAWNFGRAPGVFLRACDNEVVDGGRQAEGAAKTCQGQGRARQEGQGGRRHEGRGQQEDLECCGSLVCCAKVAELLFLGS